MEADYASETFVYGVFSCKLNAFRKRVKNAVTSKVIQVGVECQYVMGCGVN
jgi:hypothetical protein